MPGTMIDRLEGLRGAAEPKPEEHVADVLGDDVEHAEEIEDEWAEGHGPPDPANSFRSRAERAPMSPSGQPKTPAIRPNKKRQLSGISG
jgi:hypothetical protein